MGFLFQENSLLDLDWKDLDPIQYAIYLDNTSNSYIAIKSKNNNKLTKIEVSVIFVFQDIIFQNNLLVYNIGKIPTILRLTSLPEIDKIDINKIEKNIVLREVNLQEITKINF